MTSSEASPGDESDILPLTELELGQADEPIDITVEARAHGWRLDHYLSRLFPNHSRSQLQRAVELGGVRLNGLVPKASRRLRVNDRIWIQLPDAEQSTIQAENIPLQILYEDDALVVVNKPAGMVVHPGRGSSRGTLASALQFHFDQLSDVGGRHRPGIVHRLDRDTTGVILVAKDNQVHQKISSQFERREVKKVYQAIVRGVPEMVSDIIQTWVCVHNRVREKMMVCPEGGNAREAVTFYRTAEDFRHFALMELHPRTGRTHQLRVHMLHIATPILADKLYLGQSEFRRSEVQRLLGSTGAGASTTDSIDQQPDEVLISRQALHAWRLTIRHPHTGQEMQFEAPLPQDFERTLQCLRDTAQRRQVTV
jgi:23S rRNA pseudouridine1911/1915/1917 synthase